MSWVATAHGSMTQTRLAKPSHVEWVPDDYQLRGVDHLVSRLSGGLALDPGLGKTAITLAAFCTLLGMGRARRMLVVAPLRVCRQVWRQEGAKWTQFRHLRFVLLHGDKKDKVLRASLTGTDADPHIYLLNPEAVQWLCSKYEGRQLPFDVVAIDELTKFKNHAAKRAKALRPRIVNVLHKWGLTGSLMPNGFMDLFGQMFMLDGGAALGRFITHFRDAYFTVGFDGFTYSLMPGAGDRIIKKIAPYWLQLSAEDYIKLPPLIDDPRMLELSKPERQLYNAMKRDMVAALPGGTITAANSAAVYAKLAQMANGAVYHQDRSVEELHTIKLDALEELVEELNGAPLLVAYEFNHDLARLKERFAYLFPGGEVPYLGNGTTAEQETRWLGAWSRNELPLLLAHPASAGHGLNMQEGHAAHLAWFSVPWDFELYDQFIRRLRRRGNDAQRIFNHLLLVRDSLDELKLQAVRGKDMTQRGAMVALNAEIRREALNAAGDPAHQESDAMVMKLTRQETAGQPAQQAAPATQAAPAGWGQAPQAQPAQATQAAPAGWGQPAGMQPADAQQRAAIQEQIAPREPARAAFGQGVGEAMGNVASGDYGPVTTDNAAMAPGNGGAPEAAGMAPAGWGAQPQTAEQPAPKRQRAPRAPAATPEPAAESQAPLNAALRLRAAQIIWENSELSSMEEGLGAAEELFQWAIAAK